MQLKHTVHRYWNMFWFCTGVINCLGKVDKEKSKEEYLTSINDDIILSKLFKIFACFTLNDITYIIYIYFYHGTDYKPRALSPFLLLFLPISPSSYFSPGNYNSIVIHFTIIRLALWDMNDTLPITSFVEFELRTKQSLIMHLITDMNCKHIDAYLCRHKQINLAHTNFQKSLLKLRTMSYQLQLIYVSLS